MGKHTSNSDEPFDPDAVDYPVGYKKPPADSQFKPGKSGWPSGRPKKVPSEKDALSRALAMERIVQTPDGPKKMTGPDLLAARLLKDAIEGKVGQTRTLYARMDVHGIGREEEVEDLSVADEKVFNQFYAHLKRQAGGSDDV